MLYLPALEFLGFALKHLLLTVARNRVRYVDLKYTKTGLPAEILGGFYISSKTCRILLQLFILLHLKS